MRNQLRLLRDVTALILIASTWRLWFAASDFPAIPFFSFLTTVPHGADQVLSTVLVASMFVDACIAIESLTCVSLRYRSLLIERWCEALFLLSATCLILLNQHCLQPWLYHFMILTPLLWRCGSGSSGAPGETAMPEPEDTASRQCAVRKQLIRILILWFTASIYIWSAWSKLDASFIQSHGPKFVLAILDAVGISTRFWSEENWQLAAVMLPIIELVVGVGLLFRRIRGFALLASLLMHLLLIVAVGPWGLDHSPAVLLWNGFFIAQNVILFVSGRRADATAGVSGSESVNETHTDANPASAPRPNFAIAVTVAVILIPALRSVGCCDAWPAWAVYASSPARVLVQVRNDSVDRQPKSLRKYVESRKINDGWSWLRIDLWSLNATGTPIYPADRFQFAIARSIWEDSQFPNSIRVVQESDADRMTGKRDRTQVIDESEIAEFGTRFRLNSMPR